VVKAFNSVGNAQMVNPHYEQGTPTMFLCGDNDAAKSQVSEIIKQFGWEPPRPVESRLQGSDALSPRRPGYNRPDQGGISDGENRKLRSGFLLLG
jgi:hypothetical protein